MMGGCRPKRKEVEEDIRTRNKTEYRGSLTEAQVNELGREKIPIYYVISQNLFNRDMTGLDLRMAGAREIK